MWNRVAIGDSDIVQGSIITTWASVAWFLLGHHVQWRGPVTGRGAHNTELHHVLKLVTGNFEALRGQASGACKHRRASSLNVVCYIVLDWRFAGARVRDRRELGKNCFKI